MPGTLWRALELRLPEASIMVDVAHSGRFAKQVVSGCSEGVTRTITTLDELRDFLVHVEGSAKQLAVEDPVSFAYLVCVLAGKPNHIFPRETMWPELEQYFGLSRSANGPIVVGDIFQFLVYSQYMPTLKLSRITVELSSLVLHEEILVESPWPPEGEGEVSSETSTSEVVPGAVGGQRRSTK